MAFSKVKVKTIVASFFLMLTMIFAVFALPSTIAVILPERDTYAYVTVSPNPIGVGQTALVVMWLTEPLPSALFGWEGFLLTVTKPDGTNETLGPYRSESTGSTFALYTPTEVGTYFFQFSFPGQWLNQSATAFSPATERFYRASTSNRYELTVQSAPIPSYPTVPLPEDYWERPIYGENRDWSIIGGNFLDPAGIAGLGSFGIGMANLFTTGPETPHVMWTRQHDFGGIVGGPDDRGYYTGLSYQRKWRGIIINGRLYYSNPNPPQQTGFHSVDLRTGEEFFAKNESGSTGFGWSMLGQVMRFEAPNQHGNFAYLWYAAGGGVYRLYDPFSGNWLCDIANVSAGTLVRGESGELLIYNIFENATTGTRQMSLWNSTRIAAFTAGAVGGFGFSWNIPYGRTIDGNTAYQWVKNLTRIPGVAIASQPAPIRLIHADNIVYCRSQVMTVNQEAAIHAAYDLTSTNGEPLWFANRTGLFALPNFVNLGAMGEGVYCEFIKETLQWVAYDVQTGAQKWLSEPFANPWSVYYGCSVIAYGKLFTGHYDGLHALDVVTGEEVWSFSVPSGFETPYGVYPIFTFHDGITVADGKVYGVTGEHSPNDPLYKGEKLYCINATDGSKIWSISCWGLPPAIADGYAATLNHYDMKIYSFGKGPSKTTVTAPDTAARLGDTITIKGTVLDQSPAQKDTACVSDASMETWMAYLHMQQPINGIYGNETVTGVPVTLAVIDANGNFREIGTTTSDVSGNFAFAWEPDISGFYSVIATFSGSKAYGSSFSMTGFNVMDVSAASPTPVPPFGTPTDMYVLGSAIAIIIVIIIVGAIIVLMLRRRP